MKKSRSWQEPRSKKHAASSLVLLPLPPEKRDPSLSLVDHHRPTQPSYNRSRRQCSLSPSPAECFRPPPDPPPPSSALEHLALPSSLWPRTRHGTHLSPVSQSDELTRFPKGIDGLWPAFLDALADDHSISLTDLGSEALITKGRAVKVGVNGSRWLHVSGFYSAVRRKPTRRVGRTGKGQQLGLLGASHDVITGAGAVSSKCGHSWA